MQSLPWYFWILLLIYVGVCVFLILVVLLQSGKGGGISSLMGGSSLGDQLGATGAEKTLNKWTTICAVSFGVLAITLTLIGAHKSKPASIIDDIIESPPPLVSTSASDAEGLQAVPPAIDVEVQEPELLPETESQTGEAAADTGSLAPPPPEPEEAPPAETD
jgi:preprotein translocase subunit SecG